MANCDDQHCNKDIFGTGTGGAFASGYNVSPGSGVGGFETFGDVAGIRDRGVGADCGGFGDGALNSEDPNNAFGFQGVGSGSLNPQESIDYVSNLIREVSTRFGGTTAGIILNGEIITQDLQDQLNDIVTAMEDRIDSVSDFHADSYDPEFEVPDANDGGLSDVALDHYNPIKKSTVNKTGKCRINFGCQLCEFPGDITIPPFPGLPAFNFPDLTKEICGIPDFMYTLSQLRSFVAGFKMFFRSIGAFTYAVVDLTAMLAAVLGRCIVRILMCLSRALGDLNWDLGMLELGAEVREAIIATSAMIAGAFAALEAVVTAIMLIVQGILNEIMRIIDLILGLCDPCKAISFLANPSAIIPRFGFI